MKIYEFMNVSDGGYNNGIFMIDWQQSGEILLMLVYFEFFFLLNFTALRMWTGKYLFTSVWSLSFYFVCDSLFHRKDLNEWISFSALCPKPKQSLLQPHVFVYIQTSTRSNKKNLGNSFFFVQRTKKTLSTERAWRNGMVEAKQVNIIELLPFL